jgi:hypothetical protein
MRYDIYNKGVTADMIRQAIDMYVIGFRAERNRKIMKYKLADGHTFEETAEYFDMSVAGIKRIVYRYQYTIFKAVFEIE